MGRDETLSQPFLTVGTHQPLELTWLPDSRPGPCGLLQLSSQILYRSERRHLKLIPRRPC